MLVEYLIEYLKKCDLKATVMFSADEIGQSVIECVEHNIRSNTVCFYDRTPNWKKIDKDGGIEIQVLFIETTYREL